MKLSDIASAWLSTHSDEEAILFLKEKIDKSYSESSVKNWRTGNVPPPLQVVEAILEESKIQINIDNDPFTGAKVFIGVPCYRTIVPQLMLSTHAVRYRFKDLGFLMEGGSYLPLVRNRLCKKFLDRGGEWLIMIDSDMAPPPGYPSKSSQWGARFDPRYNEKDFVERLMSHGKTLVSALYFDRNGHGIPMFDEGRNDPSVAKELQAGPQDKLRPTNWTGAGCLLIHRSVLEDMVREIPDIRAPHDDAPHGWFDPVYGAGEDASFCLRAKQIGHQPYVDLGCVCGHVGEIIYFNEKIR